MLYVYKQKMPPVTRSQKVRSKPGPVRSVQNVYARATTMAMANTSLTERQMRWVTVWLTKQQRQGHPRFDTLNATERVLVLRFLNEAMPKRTRIDSIKALRLVVDAAMSHANDVSCTTDKGKPKNVTPADRRLSRAASYIAHHAGVSLKSVVRFGAACVPFMWPVIRRLLNNVEVQRAIQAYLYGVVNGWSAARASARNRV